MRGASTEITTYDNDGFLVGTRVSMKNPDTLFFDEITGTMAFLGDLKDPNVFNRFDRIDEVNYYHFLLGKKIGQRAVISGDYTSQWGISTLRQAIKFEVPQLKVADSIRFENYQRVEGVKAYGFAFQFDKKLHRRFSFGGGVASIDTSYGGLNGDRFKKGNRVFAVTKISLPQGFGTQVFVQNGFSNEFRDTNGFRLDMILTYDILPGLKKAGVF